MQLRFDRAAAEEFLHAVEFYDEQSPGLGAELVAEYIRIAELLLAAPDMGSPGPSGTRRVLLSRFPFSLAYLVREEDIIIVAFAHQHRQPGYWIDGVQ